MTLPEGEVEEIASVPSAGKDARRRRDCPLSDKMSTRNEKKRKSGGDDDFNQI